MFGREAGVEGIREKPVDEIRGVAGPRGASPHFSNSQGHIWGLVCTHTDTSSTSNSANEKPIFPLPLSELLLLSSQALACPAQSTGHDRKGSQVGLHLLQ